MTTPRSLPRSIRGRCRNQRGASRGLRDRRIHKRAVEISARAFELYARLGNLFYDPLPPRDVSCGWPSGFGEDLGEAVPPKRS